MASAETGLQVTVVDSVLAAAAMPMVQALVLVDADRKSVATITAGSVRVKSRKVVNAATLPKTKR